MKVKVVSLIVAGLLLTTGVAWGQGRYLDIQAYFDKIHVNINGQQIAMPKDSIVFEGSVYVPVRNLMEGLGADVAWDNDNRTIHLDFLKDNTEQVDSMYNASQKKLYQYIVIQHQLKLTELTTAIQEEDFDKMKQIVLDYEELRDLVRGMEDWDTMRYLEKMKTATDLIRTGLESKQVDDYYLAWTLFKVNVQSLDDHLETLLERTTFSLEDVRTVE